MVAVLNYFLSALIAIIILCSPYFSFATTPGGISAWHENWSAENEFTADYAFTLEKDPDKDFVVMNLADIQLSTAEVYGENGKIAKATIAKCIKEVQPDLITLSGDNAWCDYGYLNIIEYIDSFGIPWAATFGNHDGDNGNRIREAFDAYLINKAENSIFKFGPEGMGYGNYIINITENGEIIHTIYMMDTHTDAEDTDAGVVNYGKNEDGSDKTGYDHLWANQIEWYKWCVNGVNSIAGKTVESSVIFHIPVIQYRYAMNEMCDVVYDENGGFVTATPKAEYADSAYGSIDEWICSPEGDNGFFDVCKELGSTKNMIAGHDHVNNLSLEYEGIRLSYSLKCGPGCYWDEAKNGCSTLTIGSDGHATFAHHYVAA